MKKRPGNTHRLYTLGTLYLKQACLKAGWECVLLDAYFYNMLREDTIKSIADLGVFDVIGFTLNDDAMLNEANAICERLEDNAIIIAGGVYASQMARKILDTSRYIQHIFLGEAEVSLESFLRGRNSGLEGVLSRKGNDIVGSGKKISTVKYIDSLGGWNYSELSKVLSIHEYSLVTSRGCSARCGFCVIAPHWSRYGDWRGHSAAWIVDKFFELKSLGVKYVNIVDDQFIGSPDSIKRCYELVDCLAREGGSLSFSIMVRAETVINEKDLFMALKSVGLSSVYLGLESGNDKVLSMLNKGASAMDGEIAVNTLDLLGLHISSGTIFFHPLTTIDTLRGDIFYFRRLLHKFQMFDFYSINELDLLNGTPMSKLWGDGSDGWKSSWKCRGEEADLVFTNWLAVQRRFLFPLQRQVGDSPEKSVRRNLCFLMLYCLELLLPSPDRRSVDIFLCVSLATQKFIVSNGLHQTPLLAISKCEDDVSERCFG